MFNNADPKGMDLNEKLRLMEQELDRQLDYALLRDGDCEGLRLTLDGDQYIGGAGQIEGGDPPPKERQ